MFGLTELTAQLNEPVKLAIIPTFVIPFTILGMILTSLATWIAALFGMELKAEGPKRLFEVLMKPKILILAVVSNLVFYAFYQGGIYLKNSSRPLWLIDFKNQPTLNNSKTYENFKSENFIFDKEKIVQTPRPIKSIDVVWKNDLKNAVFGGVISSGSSLFMGTRGGSLIELDLKTGNKIREIWTGQPVMTMPLILDQQIYFGEGVHETHHARYYNYNLLTGSLSASFESLGHIERKAAFAELNQNQILLIPAGRDGVYAVNSKTMEKIWQAKIGHVDSSPISDGERVYFGTGVEKGFDDTETVAAAVDLKTGALIWKKNLPTSSWGIPILWKDLVCFSSGDIYKNTDYGQFSCYNRQTGSEDLSINTSGALISQPIRIGDLILISDVHGVIYQLNLTEKKIDWKISVASKNLNYSSVLLDDEDRIILPGTEGLSIFDRKSQKLLYQWKPNVQPENLSENQTENQKNELWRKPYTNILIKNDLWIVADGAGVIWALKPVF